ncbi:MAG: isochorismate synthase [Candidatus Zixiibacteriota bacterium]|nr:MAG: isochorismate synthase [candidate division Zixibacteria bacterium]
MADKSLSKAEVQHERLIDKLRKEVKRLLESAAIGGEAGISPIKSLAMAVEDCSPLDWLRSQNANRKVYWSDRSAKFETAGIGAADWIDESTHPDEHDGLKIIQDNLVASNDGVRYYGGFRFDNSSASDNDWRPFGKYFFVVPRFEMYRSSGRSWLVCNLFFKNDRNNPEDVLREFNKLSYVRPSENNDLQTLVSRTDSPDKTRFRDMIKSAMESFSRQQFEKIVLAKKADLEFDNAIDRLLLMHKLKRETSDCFHFYLQPTSDTAFMGATPERLYHRNGKRIQCDAIAGTRPRGDSEHEDQRMGEELLSSEKDRREHRFVVDSITEALSAKCDVTIHPADDPPTLLKLERVQHLYTRIECTLNNTVTDAQFVAALHPTAAVGGYPRAGIVDEIRRLEQFDRGWYAAPVGWISKNTAEFAVAIRSALARKNHLCLYAGAGILNGSNAAAEWEEIENKMRNFLKLVRQ